MWQCNAQCLKRCFCVRWRWRWSAWPHIAITRDHSQKASLMLRTGHEKIMLWLCCEIHIIQPYNMNKNHTNFSTQCTRHASHAIQCLFVFSGGIDTWGRVTMLKKCNDTSFRSTSQANYVFRKRSVLCASNFTFTPEVLKEENNWIALDEILYNEQN